MLTLEMTERFCEDCSAILPLGKRRGLCDECIGRGWDTKVFIGKSRFKSTTVRGKTRELAAQILRLARLRGGVLHFHEVDEFVGRAKLEIDKELLAKITTRWGQKGLLKKNKYLARYDVGPARWSA